MKYTDQIIASILFIILTVSAAVGQIPDISGDRWYGTSHFGTKYLEINYSFEQRGDSIWAIVNQKTLKGKDSAEFHMSGTWDGEQFVLTDTEFIYKTTTWCAAVAELSFQENAQRQILRGKWKGDWRLTTCPPGFSGNLELTRVESEAKPVIATRSGETVTVDEGDNIGQGLINELSKRNYYALIIGVENYKAAGIESLDNPIDDARAFKEVLETYYTFKPQNIILLEDPGRTDIIESFDGLADRVTEKDQLLVFYAGHGIWDERLSQGFWLPSDASKNSKAQWLSNSTIRDYIRGIPSKHTLLVTDACFSGSIFKERAVYSESRAILEMYKMPSRKALTSGTLTTVPDKSVFIQYLLKYLSDPEDPFVSSDALYRNLRTSVINNSPTHQVPQYGAIHQAGDEGGEFIFLRRKPSEK